MCSSDLQNYNTLQAKGALINGMMPDKSYGLWNQPGTNYNTYAHHEYNSLQLKFNVLYKINQSSIELGAEHTRSVYRYYEVNKANELWSLMNNLVNKQITHLDTNWSLKIADIDGDGILDSIIDRDFVYNQSEQSVFDRNLRTQLGLPINGNGVNDFIDVYNYNPETFSLELFSADELLNNGNAFVNYLGYNPYGTKVMTGNNNGFTESKGDNGLDRSINPFNPIATAIYGSYSIDEQFLRLTVGAKIGRASCRERV